MKPLSKLTRLLRVLLKIDVFLCIVAVLVGIYGCVEYSRYKSTVDPNETLLPSDIANTIVGLVQLLLGAFLGITFLRWIHRANKNLRTLSSMPMVFTPGWSVGWYFIPIANFYKPYQAMKELWAVAHRGTSAHSSLLTWWWCLWLVSNYVGRVAMKLTLRADTAPARAQSAAAYVASDAVDITLNIVALLLVTAISKAYSSNYVEEPVSPNHEEVSPPVISQ